jgi:uncharacterized membrane protein YqjE
MDPQVAQTESLAGLVRGILSDVRTLVREEIALARIEIKEQLGRARAAAIALGAAVVTLAFGFTFLMIAFALGVADALDWPAWAGFLVVAVVLGLTGAISLTSARRQLQHVHAVPEETVSTLKENSEWIARRLSSVRK